MKKLLGIVVLGLLCSNLSLAEDKDSIGDLWKKLGETQYKKELEERLRQLESENSNSELLRLSCKASDNSMTNNVFIDMSEKKRGGIVQGYLATAQISSDRFVLEYTLVGSTSSINVLLSIDRKSGIYNETWTNKKSNQSSNFNGICSLAKKNKF